MLEIRSGAADGSGDCELEIHKRGKSSKKWRPSRLCHFTSARQPGPAAMTKAALSMAIVMATPVMRCPTSGKQG